MRGEFPLEAAAPRTQQLAALTQRCCRVIVEMGSGNVRDLQKCRVLALPGSLRWEIEPGEFKVLVGSSSDKLELAGR
jgi:hypothetical protein